MRPTRWSTRAADRAETEIEVSWPPPVTMVVGLPKLPIGFFKEVSDELRGVWQTGRRTRDARFLWGSRLPELCQQTWKLIAFRCEHPTLSFLQLLVHARLGDMVLFAGEEAANLSCLPIGSGQVLIKNNETFSTLFFGDTNGMASV